MTRFLARVLLAAGLSFTATAAAQDDPVPLGEFSALRFVPAAGNHNFLMTDGARVEGHLVPWVGLVLDYANRPFVIYDATCPVDDPMMLNCDIEGESVALIEYAFVAHVLGALPISNRVQINLDVPLAYSSTETFDIPGAMPPTGIRGSSGMALADIRVSVKARIYGEGEGLNFGALLFGTVPTGQITAGGEEGDPRPQSRFIGEDGPTFGGHVIGQFDQREFHVAGNVGGIWRPTTSVLFSTEVGSQLTYALAFGYDVTPLLQLFAEVNGSSTFGSQVDENPLEGRLAGRLRQGDLTFMLGGGAGLISGVGVPQFRINAAFAYAPMRGDRDGDRVEDRADTCPDQAEDRDQWEDEDGCPEPDNDEDGMADAQDRCPDEAEDRDEVQDDDGCPDRDNDGDGVQDGYDSCPAEPEDMDGDRDDDGCPEQDRDRDGVNDDVDRCPEEAEDTDGFGDEDGCPEVDFDQDGVNDDQDQCPDVAEDRDGFEDEDGCTEEGGPPPAAPAGGGRPRRGR
jgi:hypothetical protein